MVANIAEVLSKVSPIIGTAPFVEGNQMDALGAAIEAARKSAKG